jgi:hypothetical protein
MEIFIERSIICENSPDKRTTENPLKFKWQKFQQFKWGKVFVCIFYDMEKCRLIFLRYLKVLPGIAHSAVNWNKVLFSRILFVLHGMFLHKASPHLQINPQFYDRNNTNSENQT